MPRRFNSDYVSTPVTEAASSASAGVDQTTTVTTSGVTGRLAEQAQADAFGFELRQYGLGKPRRIKIRGKIAIE